ncbi:glycosyltransferase [Aetokthonos hydrillicola Thurmond2011]|uniref:Glycosyltransferase n=1 Tax=Aetokthonos hydrillicola Thurmond2011 TaxID=2712845 RepID=A0AAP5IAM6_9CYAN|nr:glycosyltransferase [Aetokthonos hydrillicola]MDR9898001.1 glycosyltransferase [Aetokthonos hydrillicola Thurmond2011]
MDYPKCDILYKNNICNYQHKGEGSRSILYGLGFTLYGLLEDIPIDRLDITQKVVNGYFNLIIFFNIFNTFGLFVELLPYLNFKNTLILDGADTPQPYPYAGKWWRYPQWWFLPKAHTHFLYFKREWTPETIRNLWFQIPPKWLCQYLPAPKNFRPISFSIPEEKIVKELSKKTKLFPKHIVDPEVARYVSESSTNYAFSKENEYYSDLQASKFGITTKRAGWDCLRHYEIAANGCVPCFRNLDKKPPTCAPHGLDDSNCIIYRSYDELMHKISALSDEGYEKLQAGALRWVKKNTTVEKAKQLLEGFKYD